jgi:signal transduction histidine kinase
VAVVLLAVHDVTSEDPLLIVLTVAWTAATLTAFGRSPILRSSPVAWAADMAAALGLVLASGDWRSPFYVFALTTLILPATGVHQRRALAWGAAFCAAYGVVALLTGMVPDDTLADTIRLETLATHLFVPLIVVLALAHASHLLERLRGAQARSELLAVQAERQRIAWELHDSAKQRVHAAHLLLSAVDGHALGAQREVVEHALAELRAATADMETSVAELRMPLDSRPVDDLLRERAADLERVGGARIAIDGRLPILPPLVAAHTYRIAAEALTNAVRHAGCSTVTVTLDDADGRGRVLVADDGVGLPAAHHPGGHGLRSMRSRAETIGAALQLGPGADGRGTVVQLILPD